MKRPAVLPRGAGRGRCSPCSGTASPGRTARSGVRGPRRPVRLGYRIDLRRRSGEPAPSRDRLHPQLERCGRRGVVRGRWDDVGRGGPADDRAPLAAAGSTTPAASIRSSPRPARRGARAGDHRARRHRDDQAERYGRRDAKRRDHRPLTWRRQRAGSEHGEVNAARARRARFPTVEGPWAGLIGSARGPPGSPGPGGRADRLPHRAVPATRVAMSLRATRTRKGGLDCDLGHPLQVEG
jgi:hypothetical protein